jgi:hypothetical protein
VSAKYVSEVLTWLEEERVGGANFRQVVSRRERTKKSEDPRICHDWRFLNLFEISVSGKEPIESNGMSVNSTNSLSANIYCIHDSIIAH